MEFTFETYVGCFYIFHRDEYDREIYAIVDNGDTYNSFYQHDHIDLDINKILLSTKEYDGRTMPYFLCDISLVNPAESIKKYINNYRN